MKLTDRLNIFCFKIISIWKEETILEYLLRLGLDVTPIKPDDEIEGYYICNIKNHAKYNRETLLHIFSSVDMFEYFPVDDGEWQSISNIHDKMDIIYII